MILNNLAIEIWNSCIEYDAHISAAHVPGVHNVLADSASREFHDSAELMIPSDIFHKLIHTFGEPEIDMFASRLNKQLPVYASWKPDPDSSIIDAMSVSWSDTFLYVFPPFSMLWPIITKLETDKVERAIMIVPRWPTQSWFPRLMKKALMDLFAIQSRSLLLPGTEKTHPLSPKLVLLAVLCHWQDQNKTS